jgi:hypothetical protein
MINSEEQAERRQCKRFQVEDGAYIILKPFDGRVGRILDISIDGLTFDYVSGEQPSNMPNELDITMANGTCRLRNVPCKIISDFETEYVHLVPLSIRRCGVQFGDLTPDQISQLEYFIHNHTVGEA